MKLERSMGLCKRSFSGPDFQVNVRNDPDEYKKHKLQNSMSFLSGLFWILTLRSSAQSPSHTSTVTHVSCAGNISRAVAKNHTPTHTACRKVTMYSSTWRLTSSIVYLITMKLSILLWMISL